MQKISDIISSCYKKILTISSKSIIPTIFFLIGFTVGCTIFPKESIPTISKVIGIATGTVVQNLNIDNETKNMICYVCEKVASNIPDVSKSCVESWGEIADTELDILVAEGKLDSNLKDVVKNGVILCASGMDYLFGKYPDVKTNRDLILTSITSFIDGVNSMIIPSNILQSNTENVKLIALHKDIYVDAIDYIEENNQFDTTK